MKKYYGVAFFSIATLFGCTHMIRVDADTYIQNQASYEGKHTIIKSELEDVLENYELFQGKDIEITAPVTHFEERDSPAWFLTLEKNGKKIRGYEDDYIGYVPPDTLYLARWARREGGEVTARGKLKKGGIELDQLSYKNFIVNTNDMPS